MQYRYYTPEGYVYLTQDAYSRVSQVLHTKYANQSLSPASLYCRLQYERGFLELTRHQYEQFVEKLIQVFGASKLRAPTPPLPPRSPNQVREFRVRISDYPADQWTSFDDLITQMSKNFKL